MLYMSWKELECFARGVSYQHTVFHANSTAVSLSDPHKATALSKVDFAKST